MLAAEDHRDGDTWAVHLLDLKARALNPDYTIADAGTGLRAGQKLAWPDTSGAFWHGWNRLHAAMGRKFYGVWSAVSQAMQSTPRSSSLVENLNSRRRNCLTLRRHLNGSRAWLGLLQFFVNHRRFMRSRCGKRLGKSPREAMTGEDHPHWLTLLGLGPLQPRQS